MPDTTEDRVFGRLVAGFRYPGHATGRWRFDKTKPAGCCPRERAFLFSRAVLLQPRQLRDIGCNAPGLAADEQPAAAQL
jgi:hypothetical protein